MPLQVPFFIFKAVQNGNSRFFGCCISCYIYMVLAAPLLGFTGYLHVFHMVQKAFDFKFPGYFQDISRIFTWFWQPPFLGFQDIYMFFVRFKKPSTSNFHDISRIFPGYFHGSSSPPFGIYRIFTCFSYGLESLRLRISMMFPGYLRDIYMVVAAPLLGFTGYLHVFCMV